MNKVVKYAIIAVLLVLLSVFALMIFKDRGNHRSKDELNIYFSKLVGADVIVEPVRRKLLKGQSPISQSLNELIAGPTKEEQDNGFYTEIPQGTRIIKITEEPDTVRININNQFASGGGSSSIEARLKELIYTSLDAEPIKKVYLDLDSEEVEILGGEGLEVIQPLTKENFANDNNNEN